MSQRQPIHRRASWAQRERSYQAYMRNDRSVARSPSQDYGIENFSYDDAYLSQWQPPKDLGQHLPAPLKQELHDWSYAGAAVCTALERIAQLQSEAPYRGWPDKSGMGHLSRQTSKASPLPTPAAVSGAESPSFSFGSPSAMTPLPEALVPLDQQKAAFTKSSTTTKPVVTLNTTAHHQNLAPIGMESPPFTPVNSQVLTTPVDPVQGPRATLPDLSRIPDQLSPLQSPMTMSPTSTNTTTSPMLAPSSSPLTFFDENAWETYINCVRAELQDIRANALQRWKGFARSIETLRHEFGGQSEWYAPMGEFGVWWERMKPKAAEYEDRVKALAVPDLETVTRERAARGLPA